MDTSPVKNGDLHETAAPLPVSHESLLEASDLLLDNLGSADLNSRSIQWDNFPALMKLWEVLYQAQASLVQEAERLLEVLEDWQGIADDGLEEIKADMEEVRAGKHDERDRHFALGLYWRRYAIWRYFRTHLQQPEKARDLLHLYLVKPVGPGQPTGEACRPKCITKQEQTLLLDLASKQRNRIRQLAQWLTDHPEAASLLKDTKGKGKGRARDADENNIVQRQKAHFERCLEEVEPRQRLKELIASTDDWIQCFKTRLDAVRDAKLTLQSLEERQKKKPATVQKKVKKRHTGSIVEVEIAQPKRRRTVDRGTSPIQEIVDKSVYLEHSRDYSRQSASRSPEGSAPVQAGPSSHAVAAASAASETALQEDDSPPSPQSLPSPPPHGQVRTKQPPQTATDESQQSTNDSSFKPPSIPSVRSLPPAQSSNSGDDGFRMTMVQDIHASINAEGVKGESDTTTPKVITHPVVNKPKKRISKLPPITPEVQQLLEEAAAEAEKKRKEERAKQGIFSYDPWDGLWVPPPAPQSVPLNGQVPHEQQDVAEKEAIQSSASLEAYEEIMMTARSRVLGTFEALDAESSGSASHGRREQEEDEARIAEFLRSEEM